MNSINSNQINALLDTLHFKSFDKVYASVKRQFPNITKKLLRKILLMVITNLILELMANERRLKSIVLLL